jgi:two-component system chemotaxis response regulator CheY
MTINLNTLSILLVEDTAPMRKIMVSVLEILGFKTIYSAASGAAGFQLFKDHNPDIVITDWMMEPMDGVELIKMIRTNPDSPNPFVPIILVTGYAATTKVKIARDNGMTEFLVKPFTGKELAARITHVINRPRDFVEAPSFIGPDRRRRPDDDYDGPVRRHVDKSKRRKGAAS